MVNDVEQDMVSGRGCELTFCSDPNQHGVFTAWSKDCA